MEADFTSQPPDSTALRADERDVEVGRETERERERERECRMAEEGETAKYITSRLERKKKRKERERDLKRIVVLGV